MNQPYATFNITKGTNAPHSVGSPGDAKTPISDDGLTPVAAATKGSTSDTPEIIKMLVKHGMCTAGVKVSRNAIPGPGNLILECSGCKIIGFHSQNLRSWAQQVSNLRYSNPIVNESLKFHIFTIINIHC